MTNFVYMVHPDIPGSHQEVPDDSAAIEYQSARGWTTADRPETAVPELDPVLTDSEFVTMYHPDMDVTHEFPSNAIAIAGAEAVGWQLGPKPVDTLPETDTDTETPVSEESSKPAKRTAKSKGVTDND